MKKDQETPHLVEPRSNPSDAERGRRLSRKEKIKYHLMLTAGIMLFIAPFLFIMLILYGILPAEYQMLILVFGLGFFVSLFLIDVGITKGRDHRYHRGIND